MGLWFGGYFFFSYLVIVVQMFLCEILFLLLFYGGQARA